MSKLPHTVRRKHEPGKGAGPFSNGRLPDVFRRRISRKAVIDFTRGLAVMVGARVPLVPALSTSINQTGNSEFKRVLEEVREGVRSGKGFAKCLSQYPEVFDQIYIHMVGVGEVAGILDQVLLRIASYMEWRYNLVKKVQSALAYPVLILTVALITVIFLLVFIVPTFEGMYADFDAQLPGPTQMILDLSDFLVSNSVFILAGCVGLAIGTRWIYRHPKGRYVFDRMLLKIPLLGSTFTKVYLTRFCQTLGTMLRSGVSLLAALEIQKEASENRVIRAAIEKLIASVKRGDSLKASLKNTGIFPGMVVQMIAVGEETSELDEMLLHVADHYDKELELTVATMTSVLEPLLIVTLGIVIGSIVIAMYLPIFELTDIIR